MYEKQSTAETLKALEGNWDKGLSSMQADARRQEYGLNKLKEQKKKELEEIKKAKELKKEMTFEYIDEIGEETTNKDGKDIDDDFW